MTSSLAWNDIDRQSMARALELGRRGLYTADPNPYVGCVLRRDGAIVGEGWHAKAGGPHAEAAALAVAGEAARGATAYVTLEPCSHFGRTPPCSRALIAAGIKRVVYAIDDPNPQVAGRGAAELRAAGVTVEGGLMAAEAEALHAGYLKRRRTGRPFVRVKLAASLDGRTALASGESRWITSKTARADVQYYRARSSVVLTGIGTVLADDPAMNVRIEESNRQPLRVVLDSSLRIPPESRLINRQGNVLIAGTGDDAARREALERKGVEVLIFPATQGRPDLGAVLDLLGSRGANELWVEAGAVLAGAFVREGLFDELVIYFAPTLLGSDARPLLSLPPLPELAARPRLHFTECVAVGDDLRVTAVPVPAEAS
ncbi:MAG TPA: bifunctional diaminohydroxyphosphoribosylaminopyrimidine deaminase/5-amino-6-(5-phosphoribosylamino)uracil reductase RibD [Steroidobacteraceae bacterium]|nr:bifunctional diaminohydroxyphosphoribosylaminopyrimidine deaminase/5-amino-6-(5-phosphoribosylamino)uracil reductase RibD [Steroidobacteraceae bacterium]